MGSEGDAPRKAKFRLPRVSKYQDTNSIPLAGLTGSSGGATEPGSGQGPAQPSHPIGKVGTFFLWCLGRRRTPPSQ